MAAPTLYTGNDCDLSVGGNAYKNVVASFALEFNTETAEYNTLGGTWALGGTETGTLSVTFAYDTGNASSLFSDLWAAAESGGNVAYVATVGNKTYTGECVAARPSPNAQAGEVSEVTVQMTLNGMPTMADAGVQRTATK